MTKPSGSAEGSTHPGTLRRRRARNAFDDVSDAWGELQVARRRLDRARKLLGGGEDPDERGAEWKTEAAASKTAQDLTEDEWLQAELIVLGREAKACAASLDATRGLVDATCDHLLAGDGR